MLLLFIILLILVSPFAWALYLNMRARKSLKQGGIPPIVNPDSLEDGPNEAIWRRQYRCRHCGEYHQVISTTLHGCEFVSCTKIVGGLLEFYPIEAGPKL